MKHCSICDKAWMQPISLNSVCFLLFLGMSLFQKPATAVFRKYLLSNKTSLEQIQYQTGAMRIQGAYFL